MGAPAGRPQRPPPDIEDRDPGLARERTELAWIRTAVSFTGVGAAIIRWHFIPGLVLLALGLLVWTVGRLPAGPDRDAIPAGPDRDAIPAGPDRDAIPAGSGRAPGTDAPPARVRMLLITAATLVVAAAAFVVAFTVPGPATW